MSQETVDRQKLAATLIFDDSGVANFIENQGFESVQVVADGGLGEDILILRPVQPATPDNMILDAGTVLSAAPVAQQPSIYQIAGPSGLGVPFAANVIAASEPGDVALILVSTEEFFTLSVSVHQITPADSAV